jgi:hypothetical protein
VDTIVETQWWVEPGISVIPTQVRGEAVKRVSGRTRKGKRNNREHGLYMVVKVKTMLFLCVKDMVELSIISWDGMCDPRKRKLGGPINGERGASLLANQN